MCKRDCAGLICYLLAALLVCMLERLWHKFVSAFIKSVYVAKAAVRSLEM